MLNRRHFLSALSASAITSAAAGAGSAAAQVPPLQNKVLPQTLNLKLNGTYPHDEKAFTQGLFYRSGFLYEGTGQYGFSELRKTEIKTGKVLMNVSLPQKYFGEGIALVDNRIYQLTWQEHSCFVFDADTFELKEQFRYSGEGWGLTFDGEHLIMSDGTASMRFFAPKTFKEIRKVPVYTKNKNGKKMPIQRLNELEYVHGEVWANIWQENSIARIDPKTGEASGFIDCNGLIPAALKDELSGPVMQRNRVTNGIAFDAEKDTFYITGKYWNVLYELEIVK
ncbi:glutamine cyclotransferase [Planctomycetales bacterium]|nr:glutamine cyclotransferase [Planctomycetales bacterium]